MGLVLAALLGLVICKGGGSGGSGSGGYSSGGKAAAYSHSTTSRYSKNKRYKTWDSRNGRKTKRGSALVQNDRGGQMSTLPRMYRGSSFRQRPVTYVAAGAAAGVAGFTAYRFYKNHPVDCSKQGQKFEYGIGCRKCSDWMCPIGQYRTACSRHSDSYCVPCTNKPSGNVTKENYEYTSPGNNNDCEFTKCSEAGDLCSRTTDTTPAQIVFFAEMPLGKKGFMAISDSYKKAIQQLVPGLGVQVGDVEELPQNTFVRRGMLPWFRNAESGSRGGGDVTRGEASTAGVGQQEGNQGQRRQQGAETQAECANAMCTGTGPAVVVETTVSTSMKDIDDTWDALNEKAINSGLNKQSIPPAVIKFGPEENAGSADIKIDTQLAGASISVVVFLCCLCTPVYYCNRRRKSAASGADAAAKAWNNMHPEEQKHWMVLGWDETRWITGEEPASSGRGWSELSQGELQAAMALGYTQYMWESDESPPPFVYNPVWHHNPQPCDMPMQPVDPYPVQPGSSVGQPAAASRFCAQCGTKGEGSGAYCVKCGFRIV
jgi:hypothetical protein